MIAQISEQLAAGQTVVVALGIFVSLLFVKVLFVEILANVDGYLVLTVDAKISKSYTSCLEKIPPRYFNDGSFMADLRVARDAIKNRSVSLTYNSVKKFYVILFSTVTLAYALWHLNPTVGFVALLAPIPIIFKALARSKILTTYWQQFVQTVRHSEYYTDQCAYQRQGFEAATLNGVSLFVDKSNELQHQSRKLFTTIESSTLWVELLTSIFTIAIYVTCLYLIGQQDQLGLVVATISGLASYLANLNGLEDSLKTYINGREPNKYLYNFLHTDLAHNDFVTLPATDTLKVTDVVVEYGDKQAVQGVSLDLTLGGYTALVGLNGCGKTSFIKALMNGQNQVKGTVMAGDLTVDLSDSNVALPCASVQQEYGRFEVPLRSFLQLGLDYQPTDQEIFASLEKVNMHEVVQGLPQGIDTMLGDQWDKGVNLSGGQWQRLAIARSFLSRAPIVFLDEPTSAVDAVSEEAIFKHFEDESKQRFVLVTTHRASTLKSARLIYVMRDGKIVEQGTFDQLSQPGTYFSELFASQLVI